MQVPLISLGVLLLTKISIWPLVIIYPLAFSAGWAIPSLSKLSRPENVILLRVESRGLLIRTRNTVEYFQMSLT